MSCVDLKEMGNRICKRRRQLGYTQEQVAESMNVSVQMVSNLERGIKAIKIDNLLKLSKLLDVSTDYILTGNHSSSDLDQICENISILDEQDFKMIEMLIDYCIGK